MPITNAALAQQISDLALRWRARDMEYAAWVAGTATGGPYGDGRYPLTNYLGTVVYVKCPAALQALVDGEVGSASAFADAADAYATAAQTARLAAEAARDLALAYKNDAISARDLASNYRDYAANSAANAAASEATAAAAAAEAESWAALAYPDAPADGSEYVRKDNAWVPAGGSHTHTAAQISDFSEAVDDRVANLLAAGTNVTLTYNDAANTLTISATGGGGGLTQAQILARGLGA